MEFDTHRGRGSLTVEAALVLPIFLFSMLLFLYIIQCIIYQDRIQWALVRVAREASMEQAVWEMEFMKNPVYFTNKLNQYVGSGFSISGLRSRVEKDLIFLNAEYTVRLPFRLLPFQNLHFSQSVKTRAFVGVKDRGGTESEDPIVFIIQTGRVYHKNKSCTYLEPVISKVLLQDMEQLRNLNGGRYKPCSSCTAENQRDSYVYIASYGDRYHRNRNCNRIYHNIIEIKLSEAGKRLPCSKCGGKN